MDLATLRKILELERSKGYGDSAVLGGLDRYLQRWASELPQNVLPTSYASLDTGQRVEWVEGMLRSLDTKKVKARSGPVRSTKKEKARSEPARSANKGKGQSGPARSEKKAAVNENLDAPIDIIKGLSTKLSPKFRRLGVETVRDMLYFFPRRHIDYSKRKTIAELGIGDEQTVIATVWQAREAILGGRRSTEAIVGDESGNMRVVWFNQPYLSKQLRTNSQLVLSGKVSLFKGIKVFQSPQYEPLASEDLIHTGRLIPLYPLTSGLSPRMVRKLVKDTVDQWAPCLPDFLPEEVRGRAKLLGLSEAIRQAHYPQSEQYKHRARERLAFDELFLIQLGVLSRRRDWKGGSAANRIEPNSEILQIFLTSLPFTLTGAQARVLKEILADLAEEKPMSRLLQGEVGSGKTAVATAALLATVASGYQGAFMAPTEILAEQHFLSISAILAKAGHEEKTEGSLRTFTSLLPRPITLGLLIGSMTQAEKKAVRRAISEGMVDIIIGTHALIQQGVEFKQLGLAIVDEQHRFGVMQRTALREKGPTPHLLVMTATPIPRSLALTLYGDLDLSVIDELPPGRQEIKTKWLDHEKREQAYRFLRKEVGEGRQAFTICPLIAESDFIDAKAALTEYERLSVEVFPDLRLGLVHGRLKAAEKESVMRRFREGELDILVATAVVEVGIDVPNATVMLIESADRFGLAQLHQFRGRVGRGEHQSYCILIAESPSPEASERLGLLEHARDGFELAEKDLELRGPGEFFGTRQSGLPDLKMAKLSDMKLLEVVRKEAIGLFNKDPDLSRPQHRLLKREVDRLWQDDTSMGEA